MKKNEKGAITVQFIFAFGLLFGFIMLLFVFSLTLTVAELSQYIVYSSSRNYMAAHMDQGTQEALAESKFNQLKGKFKFFFKTEHSSWFTLKEPESGCRADEAEAQGAYLFCGFSAIFNAKILNLNIPFFGSTHINTKGMTATINSYLGRHPSVRECQTFRKNRWEGIINNVETYEARQLLRGTIGSYRDREIYRSGDNGC